LGLSIALAEPSFTSMARISEIVTLEPLRCFPACGDCSDPEMRADPTGDLRIHCSSRLADGMGVAPSPTGLDPAELSFTMIDRG